MTRALPTFVALVLSVSLVTGCTSEPRFQEGPTTVTAMTFNVLCSMCNPTEAAGGKPTAHDGGGASGGAQGDVVRSAPRMRQSAAL